jgi:hypothetical protein
MPIVLSINHQMNGKSTYARQSNLFDADIVWHGWAGEFFVDWVVKTVSLKNERLLKNNELSLGHTMELYTAENAMAG